MGYKIKGALKKSKAVLIIMLILWVILSIVFIAPITTATVKATVNGVFNLSDFFEIVFTKFGTIGENLKTVFTANYIGTFLKGELYLFIVLFLISCVGFFKSMPKNEYTDIEHGSSDWATGGEQYKILNSKKGIILAEKNYLPVNKIGNTNVLVVGRFWFSENLHHTLFLMHINFLAHMYLQIQKASYMIKQQGI